MAADIQVLNQRLSQMQTERAGYEPHWQEIVDYILWFRQNITTAGQAGAKKMSNIVDGTGTRAARRFAGGFAARDANKSLIWFSLEPEDEYYKEHRGVKLWLEGLEGLYYNVFRRSNFYTAYKECLLDWSNFGSSPVFIGKHPRWGCYYQTINLGECYVAADQYGQIDTLFRKFDFTVRQAAQRWGRERLSDKAKGYFDNNKLEEKITLVHAVYPRTDYDPRKMDNLNMPWAEVYYEYTEKQQLALQKKGFHEFPYCVPRFDVMPGEVLGRGLGMEALPDIKELQQRVRDTSRAGQRALDPPLLLPHDGFAGAMIRKIPGGVNIIRSDGRPMQDKIGVFPTAANLPWAEDSNEGMRRGIRETYYYDLMSLYYDKSSTLGEFLEVAQDKMQTLGPCIERMQDEFHKPAFDRTFTVLWEQGLIPPPPREILGEDGQVKFKVIYKSPLALAQKAAVSRGIQQYVGFLGQASKVEPTVRDNLKWDDASQMVGENLGVPIKLLPSPEEIDQVRQGRAQAQQEQAMMAAAAEAAKAMPALAKGPEPGSPMEQMQIALQQGAGNA